MPRGAGGIAPRAGFQCSSASRKFLNDGRLHVVRAARRRFQCSSASRKFLNNADYSAMEQRIAGFSALQRAENSLMSCTTSAPSRCQSFQCSSASRKFLNSAG